MKKILLAIDGSDTSGAAAQEALKYLQAWPEAALTVVYVVSTAVYAVDTMTVLPDMKQYEDKAVADVKEMFTQLFADEPRAKFVAMRGIPVDVITELAKREEAELIVVGSHGRGSVRRALLGSVGEGVLHHAQVPVLIVKNPHHR